MFIFAQILPRPLSWVAGCNSSINIKYIGFINARVLASNCFYLGCNYLIKDKTLQCMGPCNVWHQEPMNPDKLCIETELLNQIKHLKWYVIWRSDTVSSNIISHDNVLFHLSVQMKDMGVKSEIKTVGMTMEMTKIMTVEKTKRRKEKEDGMKTEMMMMKAEVEKRLGMLT